MTKDEAQRRRWTFYEAVRFASKTSSVMRALLLQGLALFFLFTVAHAGSVSPGRQSGVDSVPESLISLDWDDGPAHAIVVEKHSQTLSVYECQDGFTLKHRFPCSTGEVPGNKEKSGDRKTPEGIYFITKAFKKRELSPIYGNRAFVMDYPNLLDRRHGRAGNNIWLHGTNKSLKPRDSNGCVVVENGHIDTLAPYIRLNRTPVIIEQRLHMLSPESHAANRKGVTELLEGWKSAFTTGDKVKYCDSYSEPSAGIDRLWEAWDAIRTPWQKARIAFGMGLRNVTITMGNPCVVVLFDQVLHLGRHAMTVGTKKLFLEQDENTWKIVEEVYQPSATKPEANHLMAASLARLDRLQKDYKAVAEVIAEWAEAWSSKDIARYRACYADDFYARRMDLAAWIRYKERLNKRYDSIRVLIEDLDICQKSNQSTATFVQRYRSSGNQSVGMKRLRLKRVGGLWKIYREAWHKIRE
jgi:murein L,D-transpeptidase YafK